MQTLRPIDTDVLGDVRSICFIQRDFAAAKVDEAATAMLGYILAIDRCYMIGDEPGGDAQSRVFFVARSLPFL